MTSNRSSDSDSDRRKDRRKAPPAAPSSRRQADSAVASERRTLVTSRSSRPAVAPVDSQVKRVTTAAMRTEENEAVSRKPGQDFAMFKAKCSDIRKLIEKMRQQERQPNPELKSEVVLLFTDLKQLNRSDKYRTKWGRESVNEVKAKVDSFYLKLQNLMYEVMYVQKEIKRSLDYKSKADEIDLEDLQTFLKETSDAVCGADGKDEHRLTLSRLEWELQQRIKLAEVLLQHEVLNGENIENIRKKQELLGRLRSSMINVLESLAPMASDFNYDADQETESGEAAGAASDTVAIKEEPMETTEAN